MTERRVRWGMAVILGIFAVALGAAPALALTLVVAQDGMGSAASCDDAAPTPYTTISAAVTAAAPNDIVRVCPGVYDEQVVIDKAIRVLGVTGAVVNPTPVVANTTSLFSGAPMAAIILVKDATRVTVDGLTVDGADNGLLGGCGAPTFAGIFYRNASGTISNNAVRGIKLGPGLEGCQNGLGIFVQSGGGGSSVVNIEGNSVHDFQKNGITGNEVGTDIRVSKTNVVTGWGATPFIGQNGVQIGWGAVGRVDSNVVSGHEWTGCTGACGGPTCPWTSSGILIYLSDNVRVNQNTVGRSQGGVVHLGNKSRIDGNVISDTAICDGIGVFGNDNQVKNNVVTNSGEAGIYLQGDNNEVKGNRINEAPIGILKGGGLGNVFTPNSFFNVPVPDPDVPPMAAPVTPVR